jgi:hypothetical protein
LIPIAFFGLFQVSDEFGIRMAQRRTILEVVVANFVSVSFDLSNHIGVLDGSLANEEECCRGVMSSKNFQDLERETRMWTIVKGEGHHRKLCPNPIGDIRSQSLYHAQGSEWLHPEDHKRHAQENGHRQDSQHVLSQMGSF